MAATLHQDELLDLIHQKLVNDGALGPDTSLTQNDLEYISNSLYEFSRSTEASSLGVEAKTEGQAKALVRRLFQGSAPIEDNEAWLAGWLGRKPSEIGRLRRRSRAASQPKAGPDEIQETRLFAELAALFRRELDRLTPKVSRFGLKDIVDTMDYEKLFDDLSREDELWWLDTYAPGHPAWLRNLDRAIDRGAKIRMLVLEPSSTIAQHRASEIDCEDLPAGRFLQDLQTFHDDMKRRERRAKEAGADSFRVHVYDDLLGCPIYLILRNGHPVKAYSSFYLRPASYGFPHFEWEAAEHGGVLETLAQYVRRKWPSEAF